MQGVKLEAFIFDTFAIAKRPGLMEVLRHEEFAPVKNAPGAPKDSPDTARAAVLDLHRRSAPFTLNTGMFATHGHVNPKRFSCTDLNCHAYSAS